MNQAISLLVYWYVPVLKSAVPDKALDGVFENNLEACWLCIDEDVALSRASGKKRCALPSFILRSSKAGADGVKVLNPIINPAPCGFKDLNFTVIAEFESLGLSCSSPLNENCL